MTETKKPLSQPKDLSNADLAQAGGGLASEKAPAPGRPGNTEAVVKPFVVDGPYT